MDKITIEFRQYNDDDTSTELSFIEKEEDVNCAVFHNFCKCFAYVAGFTTESIERIFGPTHYEEMI